MIPYINTPTSISVVINNQYRTVHSTHVNFNAVKRALNDLAKFPKDSLEYLLALSSLETLFDIRSFVAKVTHGRVQIGDTEVRFDGQIVAGVIAQRLLSILHAGGDIRALANFLERVSANPTLTARDEIYLFLESGNMPLTDDGCFLAFKKVCNDYSSTYPNPDGTRVYNNVGTIVSMPREDVNPDRNMTCASGLHFCSFQYLPSFGAGESSRVVIVKVAPEDVVSIPNDYQNSKGRAWRYAVIGEVPEEECEHVFNDTHVVSTYGLYEGDQFEPYDVDRDCCCDDDCPCTDYEDMNAASNDEPEWSSAPAAPAASAAPTLWRALVFEGDNKFYTGLEVADYVDSFGQRGFARASGVPRTTIQSWLNQMVKAGYPSF